MTTERRQIVRIWHPAPECGPFFELAAGVNAEVLTGAAAYQLTTGDVVAITEDNPTAGS